MSIGKLSFFTLTIIFTFLYLITKFKFFLDKVCKFCYNKQGVWIDYLCGPLVKRLRHRPFTAVTRVQISYGSPSAIGALSEPAPNGWKFVFSSLSVLKYTKYFFALLPWKTLILSHLEFKEFFTNCFSVQQGKNEAHTVVCARLSTQLRWKTERKKQSSDNTSIAEGF